MIDSPLLPHELPWNYDGDIKQSLTAHEAHKNRQKQKLLDMCLIELSQIFDLSCFFFN